MTLFQREKVSKMKKDMPEKSRVACHWEGCCEEVGLLDHVWRGWKLESEISYWLLLASTSVLFGPFFLKILPIWGIIQADSSQYEVLRFFLVCLWPPNWWSTSPFQGWQYWILLEILHMMAQECENGYFSKKKKNMKMGFSRNEINHRRNLMIQSWPNRQQKQSRNTRVQDKWLQGLLMNF